MVHQLAPGSFVTLMQRRPGTPALDRVVEPGVDLLCGPRGMVRPAKIGVPQREGRRLAGSQPQAGARGRVPDVKADRRRQKEPVGAAPRIKSARHWLDVRVDEAVLRPRQIADLSFELAC